MKTTTNKDSAIHGMINEKSKWIFIPLAIFIFMCLGTVYSWSVFRKPLEGYLALDATQSGLPYMIFLASYAVLMPVSGGLIDRYGPRKIMISGGIIVGLGWIIAGYSSNITMLSISYGIIGGGGVGIAYGAPISVIAKWFEKNKGLAVGLSLLGFGLSPFVTAPLASWLIDNYNPLYTFRVLGIAFLIIVPLFSIPFRLPETRISDDNIENCIVDSNANINTVEMMKTPEFYGLWICFTIGTFVGLMAIGITSPVAEEIVLLDSGTAALMMSIFAICNGIGRPLFGWMTDKFYPKKTAILSYTLIAIASILMIFSNTLDNKTSIFFVSFVLFWMNLGGWLAIAPAATGIFFGSRYYSRNYGYVFTGYGVGAVLGVYLSGRLRDMLGSYVYAFYPTLIVSILGIIVSSFILKHPAHKK